jgi:hypothetical protein
MIRDGLPTSIQGKPNVDGTDWSYWLHGAYADHPATVGLGRVERKIGGRGFVEFFPCILASWLFSGSIFSRSKSSLRGVCMCIFCIYGILGIDTDVP